MELQHCIACSGEVMAPQSDAYAAIATVSTAKRIGLGKPILSRLRAFGASSQVRYGVGRVGGNEQQPQAFPLLAIMKSWRLARALGGELLRAVG